MTIIYFSKQRDRQLCLVKIISDKFSSLVEAHVNPPSWPLKSMLRFPLAYFSLIFRPQKINLISPVLWNFPCSYSKITEGTKQSILLTRNEDTFLGKNATKREIKSIQDNINRIFYFPHNVKIKHFFPQKAFCKSQWTRLNCFKAQSFFFKLPYL